MMGIRRSLPVMIIYAIALHICWGVLGTIDDTTYLSTAASAPFHLFGNLTALVCIVVAVSALTGLIARFRSPLTSLMCMLPQQSLLIISAVGAAHAIYLGQFADGVVRSRFFIAADQVPAILAAIGHTVSMLRFILKGGFIWVGTRRVL